jgi:hypothetical protein
MTWILQSEGVIDHGKDRNFPGTQPIRVLDDINVFMFQNTHDNFIAELRDAINNQGFSAKIKVIYDENKIINAPYLRIADKKIHLDETFLSYLWCICHSVYTIYIQTIDFPRWNDLRGYEHYKVEEEKINNAMKLFSYANSLIISFEEWDKDKLPNPERYLAQDRDFIEQPNCFYTEATKYILCHEYIHAIKHADDIKKERYEKSHYIEFEKEADFEAIEMIKKGIFPNKLNELAIQVGITLGILSMFYFKATTTGREHPNTEDRLVTALEQMNLTDNSDCWGIALVGLSLWTEQFDLGLVWDKNLSDKEAFYYMIGQIKEYCA